MFENVDQEGHHYQLIKEISEHRKSKEALRIKDVFTNKVKTDLKCPGRPPYGGNLLLAGRMDQKIG